MNFNEVWFLVSELEGERASSFRQERWCRIFLDEGAALRIFNLRGAFDHSDRVCKNLEELESFRREGLARYHGPKASVREGLASRILRKLKHLLLADLYLPNVLKLYHRLNWLLQARSDAVVIMASSPPFSVALIGALIKLRHSEKVVFAVDMRDAWALHNALGGIKKIKRAIERRVLCIADHVTTVSKGLADEFHTHYGINVGVMYNVATHYLDLPKPKDLEWENVNININPNRRKIVYTGSTPEGHYDLKSIVGAMVHLRQTKPELADRLQLVFVGACDALRREAIRQAVRPDDIIFVGHLPHELSRSVQAGADTLLFLAHFAENNAGVVSTKLFEYLCLGKPVLPLSLHIDSDVDILLRRYCGKSLNVHSTKEMAQCLAQVAAGEVGFLPLLNEVNRVKELLEDYRKYAKHLMITLYNK